MRERKEGETVGGRLVFNMPKTPAQFSKGFADLIATAASEESSDFGMLKYTIQHGGHERTRSRLAKGAGWVALDLPRCDAQFPSFLTLLILLAACVFSLHNTLKEFIPLARHAFESATDTPPIMRTGAMFLKLFCLSSGHPIVSAVETVGSYVLLSTLLAFLCMSHALEKRFLVSRKY